MSIRSRDKNKKPTEAECRALVAIRSNRHITYTDEEFYFLLAHIADPFYSNAAIADKFHERFNKKISYETVRHYRHDKHYAPLLAQIRENLANDISDIVIATKRGRMQFLQNALEYADDYHPIELRVDQDGVEHFLEGKQPAVVAQLISQARKEVEGDSRGGRRVLETDGARVEVGADFKGKISISQMIMADDKAKNEDGTFIRKMLKQALEEEANATVE